MKALFDHYTDAGNVGGDPTDAFIDILKANKFLVSGDKIILEYLVNSSVSSFALALKIGGSNIFADATLSLAEGDNAIRVILIKDSGQNARFYFVLSNSSGQTVFYRNEIAADGLFTSDTEIKLTVQDTSESPADGTVVAKMGTVLFISAS